MTLPVDTLIEPLTEAQVKATLYDLLAALGIETTSWRPRATTRAIVAICAKVIAGLTVLIAAGIRSTSLGLKPSGVWLTLLAKYVYGIDRRTATFAATGVTLVNAGGGVYNLDPGDLILLNTTSGKTYVNTEAIALGALSSLQNVPVRAVEIGSDSTATPGEIDDFVTPLLGVTVTNPAAAVGSDEESDEELIQDCAAARGALSPFGARGAYTFFAKFRPGGKPLTKADGVTPIGVNRVQMVPGVGGALAVYVATATGDVSGSVSTPGDDLYIVDQNLRTYALGPCLTLTTATAPSVDFVILYTVYADVAAGRTADEIKDIIGAALTAWGATYPIGGLSINGSDFYIFLSAVRAIIGKADPAIIKVELDLPVVDQVLLPGERMNMVVANGSTVTLVSQP